MTSGSNIAAAGKPETAKQYASLPSFTAKEQREIIEVIYTRKLVADSILVPGADESPDDVLTNVLTEIKGGKITLSSQTVMEPEVQESLQGVPGADGQTTYTWIKYSDNADGTGLYDTPKSTTKYIGIATNKTSINESNDKSDYTWSLFKGEKGDKGDKGDTGVGISQIIEYYLATNQNSGVTALTPGWTTTIQTITAEKKYLWNYEKIVYTNDTYEITEPIIIGVYGDKGNTGRSIESIIEYYLATNASSGVTRNTSGWTTTVQTINSTNKYLWNYEKITWSSDPTTTYTDPIIIGVHGDKGDKGPQGPQGIQGPKGNDGQSQYVHIRYSANSNGSGMTTNPSSATKYVGIAVTNSPTAPSYTGFTWSKYVGEDGAQGPQGIQGPKGDDGQPTYTWIKYADTPTSGMSNYPDGKKYIGMAFNKTTETESNNYSDYQWSLMPQNIEVGGRNLVLNSTFNNGFTNWRNVQPRILLFQLNPINLIAKSLK